MMRDAFSEFFGVMIMIIFGNGSVAQVTLSAKASGEYQSISWGWGYILPLSSLTFFHFLATIFIFYVMFCATTRGKRLTSPLALE